MSIGVNDELDLANGFTSVRSTPRVVEQDLQRATTPTDVKKASSKPPPPHQDAGTLGRQLLKGLTPSGLKWKAVGVALTIADPRRLMTREIRCRHLFLEGPRPSARDHGSREAVP